MSYDFLGALGSFVRGIAPILGGSLDGLNAMSMNVSSSEPS